MPRRHGWLHRIQAGCDEATDAVPTVNIVLLARNFPHAGSWRSDAVAVSAHGAIVADGELPPEMADAALVYDPPPNLLHTFPNLRAIFSLTAGVERILGDPTLPDVPIVPLVSPEMITLMSEYVVYHVIRRRRGFETIEKHNEQRSWRWALPALPPASCRVGILGLGRLGSSCARTLRALSFEVAGWSRTPKRIFGIRCYTGESGLHALLAQTDVLVCLLPLTPATRGLLSRSLFQRLKRSASLIHASRGDCLNETDLLSALDDGQISHATIDTPTIEPLPPDHPFWTHPHVTITPHLAADPPLPSSLAELARHLQRIKEGEPLDGVVERARGY